MAATWAGEKSTHVAEDRRRGLSGWEALQSRDERQLDGFAGLIELHGTPEDWRTAGHA